MLNLKNDIWSDVKASLLLWQQYDSSLSLDSKISFNLSTIYELSGWLDTIFINFLASILVSIFNSSIEWIESWLYSILFILQYSCIDFIIEFTDSTSYSLLIEDCTSTSSLSPGINFQLAISFLTFLALRGLKYLLITSTDSLVNTLELYKAFLYESISDWELSSFII